MAELQVHLLYASAVWLAAWLLTSLPHGTATGKYWIWVATSLNFAIPLGALPHGIWPSRIGWFTARSSLLAGARIGRWAVALWLAGAIVMLIRLAVRIRAHEQQGPAVEGLLRPRIVLPHGIERLLTQDELEAVLIHERTHAARRDNLIGLLHELSLCLFWFHPFVWLTARRLALYRELSCDESVVRRGRAEELIAALAKLAEHREPFLLQATASSLIGQRLALLTQRRRPSPLLVFTFFVILTLAALGPVARAAAAAACERTHAGQGITHSH